ncbi:MAG TPA: RNA methyltransferase [Bacteroidales bacterium]|nr:RNA methyltransferase [Bacteroidales bacterium]
MRHLNSLKIKKFRESSGQFVIEGDKIVRDLLHRSDLQVEWLCATSEWLCINRDILSDRVKEVNEAGAEELSRISSFETAPPVLALMNIPQYQPDWDEIQSTVSLGLDTIQDPGNLGTIIRTANWFGIKNILCSEQCADCYNPKVIQASMGAVMNEKIHYVPLESVLQKFSKEDFMIYGTFMEGIPVNEIQGIKKGILLFGNESRGLSPGIDRFVTKKITIPAVNDSESHVESLNVASAVAIICSRLVHK